MTGQQLYALIGAVTIGVALFVAAVFAIRAGGGWSVLGWVLMALAILGAIGAVGSSITRR
jgi:predicted metalloprotease